MLTMAIVVVMIAIFIVFVLSYPSNYAPNWRDFLVAFATSLGIMVLFYSSFPGYSFGRAGLVFLASITVSVFWTALLTLAWVTKLSQRKGRKQAVNDRMIRDSIPSITYKDVWQRDGGRCVRCGSESQVELNHIVPKSRGGTNQPYNLQWLCRNCLQLKRVQERLRPKSSHRSDISTISSN